MSARQEQPATRTWWRRLPWLGLPVGFGLIIAAVVGSAVSVPTTPQFGTVPAVQAAGTGPMLQPVVQPATVIPQRLLLPSLHVNAPIVPVAVLPGGGLAVPDNPDVLGWWLGQTHLANGQGSIVIDGHVDTAADGPGALFQLRKLRPGDPVVLSTDHGRRHYVIAALRSYRKADLPAQVFTTSGSPRLVIITCGGAFNPKTRQYTDNIVVYAVPAPAGLPAQS